MTVQQHAVVACWLIPLVLGASLTLTPQPTFGTPPTHRYGYVSAIRGDTLAVFGGSDGTDTFNDFQYFDLPTGTWKEFAVVGKLPGARVYGCGALVDDRFYVFGGQADTSTRYNDIWVHRFDKLRWSTIDTTGEGPEERAYCNLFAMPSDNTTLYLFGGSTETGDNADLWSLDLVTFAWTQIDLSGFAIGRNVGKVVLLNSTDFLLFIGNGTEPSLYTYQFTMGASGVTWQALPVTGTLPSRRSLFGTALLQSTQQIFVTWGFSETYQDTNTDVWMYDIVSMTWAEIIWPSSDPAQTEKDSFLCEVYNETVLIFGGWGLEIVNNMMQYFPTTNVLTELSPVYDTQDPRAKHCAAAVGATMVVYGGYSNRELSRAVDLYDLEQQTWSVASAAGDQPPLRWGHSCVAVGVRVLIFGGETEDGLALSDLWNYNVVADSFSTVPQTGSLPPKRSRHATVMLSDSQMLVYGGTADSTVYKDIYMFDILMSTWYSITVLGASPNAAVDCVLVPHPLGGTRAVLTGGVDGTVPQTDIWVLDVNVTDNTANWTLITSGTLPAQSNHGAVTSGDSVIVGPGTIFDDLRSNFYQIQFTSSFVAAVTTLSPTMFLSYYSIVPYRNTFVLFGGYSALPGQPKAILTRERADVEALAFTQVCGTTTTAGCLPCAWGSTASGGGCGVCSTGTYASTGACRLCPAGFFGPLTAASAIIQCVPCQEGTFANVSGTTACSPCPSGATCALGASSPYFGIVPSDSTTEQQPTDNIIDHSADAIEAQKWTAVGCGGALFIVIILVFLTRHRCKWKKWDRIHSLRHFVKVGEPPIMKKTMLGGLFCFVFLIAAVWLVLTNIYGIAFNSLRAERSLVPVIIEHGVTLRANFLMTATLHGSSDECVVGVIGSDCHPSVSVHADDATFLVPPVGSTTSMFCVADTVAHSCKVTWSCNNCTASNNPSLSFVWGGRSAYATRFDWGITTSSGMPERWSMAQGTLYPTSGYVFRGLTSFTEVHLESTPVVYRVLSNETTATGLLVHYTSSTRGASLGARSFHDTTGAGLRISLASSAFSLDITVVAQLTWIGVLSSILGSVSAMLGATAVLMGLTERALLFFVKEKKCCFGHGHGHVTEIEGTWKFPRFSTSSSSSSSRGSTDNNSSSYSYKPPATLTFSGTQANGGSAGSAGSAGSFAGSAGSAGTRASGYSATQRRSSAISARGSGSEISARSGGGYSS